MSVRDRPSIEPLPLAASIEEMSVASADPVSLESKLVGSTSRAPPLASRTATTSEADPLMSVSEEPSIEPLPLAAPMEKISTTSADPESLEEKLVGSMSRLSRACLIPSAVPLISVISEPSMVPEPLKVSIEEISEALAIPLISL